MKITSPESQQDFEQYYDLRWRMLRKPWHQPRGSEQDELEARAYHVMAIDDANKPIACGRLHFISQHEAQIRYMAVEPAREKQGIGKLMLDNMESYARQQGAQHIVLHARENALGFYEKCGYENLGPSHLLFDCIQHYKMCKHLVDSPPVKSRIPPAG